MQSEDDERWRHTNIGRLLSNSLLRFERRVFALLAEEGQDQIRLTHLSVTRNLDVEGTRTTELARRANMTKQAMGEIVAQCEVLGLVKRIPDRRDARAKIVLFTDHGLEWLRAFRGALAKAELEMRVEIGYLRVDAVAAALFRYGQGYDPLRSDDPAVRDGEQEA